MKFVISAVFVIAIILATTPTSAANLKKAVDVLSDFRKAANSTSKVSRAIPLANRTRKSFVGAKAKPFAQVKPNSTSVMNNQFGRQAAGLNRTQRQTLHKSASSFGAQKKHKNAFTTRQLPNGGWSIERRIPSRNAGYSKVYETQIAKDGNKLLTNKSVLGPNGKYGKVSTKQSGKPEVILKSNK